MAKGGHAICLLASGIAVPPVLAAEDAELLANAFVQTRKQEHFPKLPATQRAKGSAQEPRLTNFEQERPSKVAQHVADWAVDSGDHAGMPFVVIDKTDAKVFVFDAKGQLRGAVPALLGLAIGDDAVPGIGQRKLSSIRPEERTTSTGRFVASLDRNLQGQEILWADYDIAMSQYLVVAGSASERRAERPASPSSLDNRISYGCINQCAGQLFQECGQPCVHRNQPHCLCAARNPFDPPAFRLVRRREACAPKDRKPGHATLGLHGRQAAGAGMLTNQLNMKRALQMEQKSDTNAYGPGPWGSGMAIMARCIAS